jgi:hypothetical protein
MTATSTNVAALTLSHTAGAPSGRQRSRALGAWRARQTATRAPALTALRTLSLDRTTTPHQQASVSSASAAAQGLSRKSGARRRARRSQAHGAARTRTTAPLAPARTARLKMGLGEGGVECGSVRVSWVLCVRRCVCLWAWCVREGGSEVRCFEESDEGSCPCGRPSTSVPYGRGLSSAVLGIGWQPLRTLRSN